MYGETRDHGLVRLIATVLRRPKDSLNLLWIIQPRMRPTMYGETRDHGLVYK